MCKADHDGHFSTSFVKGRSYLATILSTRGLAVADGNKETIYAAAEDSGWYVRKWFWTMDEWRDRQLKEIGIEE